MPSAASAAAPVTLFAAVTMQPYRSEVGKAVVPVVPEDGEADSPVSASDCDVPWSSGVVGASPAKAAAEATVTTPLAGVIVIVPPTAIAAAFLATKIVEVRRP